MNERVCIVECIGAGEITSRSVYMYDDTTDSELVIEAAEQEFARLCQKYLDLDADEIEQAVFDRIATSEDSVLTISMSFEEILH